MRICHFYRDYLFPGGIPRETQLLANAMSDSVEHVFIYCYTKDRNEEGYSTKKNLTIRKFYLPAWCWGMAFFNTPKALRHTLTENQDKLDCVILTGSFIPCNIPMAALLKNVGLPYFISPGEGFNPFTFRGVRGIRKRIYEYLFEKHAMNHAKGIRLYSNAQVKHLRERGYSNQKKFFFVKEGIDRKKIKDEMIDPYNEHLPMPDTVWCNKLVFGYLGRLSVYKKGLDLLLEAWSIYLQQGGAGCLKIAGPGTDRDLRQLSRLSMKYGLKNVEFLPPKFGLDKYKFLMDLSILVHPSRHEGVPRVIREAFAFNCPAIVTENTNLHDIIMEFEAGFVTTLNPFDIATNMKRFSTLNQNERQALRDGATIAGKNLEWGEISNTYVQEVAQRI